MISFLDSSQLAVGMVHNKGKEVLAHRHTHAYTYTVGQNWSPVMYWPVTYVRTYWQGQYVDAYTPTSQCLNEITDFWRGSLIGTLNSKGSQLTYLEQGNFPPYPTSVNSTTAMCSPVLHCICACVCIGWAPSVTSLTVYLHSATQST